MYFITHIGRFRKLILTYLFCVTALGATEQEIEQPEATIEEQASVDMVINEKGRRQDVVYGETVNRVFAPQVHDWVVLDKQRLILYATRARPYLVTLRRKANALTKSTVIVLERRDNSIDSRFDQITVDGFPYSIARIEKLSIKTAKRLRGLEVASEPEH